MAFLLGLALPLINCPVFIRPASDPRLVALSVIIPLLLLSRRVKWTEAHQVGTLFLLWCAVTLFWATSLNDGLLVMWQFLLAGGVFAIVSTLREEQVKLFFFGLIVAVSINSIVAAAQFSGVDENIYQALGTRSILKISRWASGLQINGNYLGEVGLIGVMLAIGLRRWWWALAASPSVFLSGSKAALIMASVMLCIVVWRKSRVLALAFPLVIIIGGVWHVNKIGINHDSLSTRMPMYLNSLAAVTWTGNGVGSFWTTYPTVHDAVLPSPPALYSYDKRPRTAHNDAITMLVETGIVGLAIAVWFIVMLLGRRTETDTARAGRLGVIAFLLLGAFNFPMYVPTQLIMVAACAGAMCREE